MRRLMRADLPLETQALAEFLIGTILTRRFGQGAVVSGRIVETEAYTAEDPASHSFRGRTVRNAAMFGRSFHAYVYFIYGSVFCFNVTSEAEGIGAAVLVRALEPLDGTALMRARRGPGIADRDLLRGPGRICLAFGIDRSLDGADLDSDERLWLADDGTPKPAFGTSSRIGLRRGVEQHYRYYARGSRFLSGSRRLSPERGPFDSER